MMAKGWSTGWHARSDRIARARLKACVATTDVHEYGKILVESVLRQLDVEIIDGGISTDPNDLVDQAVTTGPTSSRSPPTMEWRSVLHPAQGRARRTKQLAAGVRWWQAQPDTDGSNTSLPVDISEELASAGATVCRSVDSMIAALGEIARAPRPDTRR